jgi:long-subunit fatty acid transport protein
MAMSGASYADGYEATYSNPAGLADTRQRSIGLGYTANDFRLTVDGDDSDLPSSTGLIIGLALPLPFGGPLRNVLTLGAGFFTPTNAVMQAEAPYVERVQWPVLTRSQVVAIQLGLSVNFNRWVPGLSFGLGISGSANTIGRINVALDAANQFVSRTETQLTSHFAPIIGVRYQRPRFSLALVWHAEVASNIKMDIVVTDLPVQLPQLSIYALAQFDPHSIVAEGSYTPTEHLRIVAGATYRRWSTYPGPLSKSSDGSNTPPPPGFHDTVSPRVAAEWTHPIDRTTVAVRGGYAFEQSPARWASLRTALNNVGEPRGDGSMIPVRYLDSHRHALSVGFGVEHRLAGENAMRFRLDVAGMLQVVSARTHALSQEGRTDPMDSRGLIPGVSLAAGASW